MSVVKGLTAEEIQESVALRQHDLLDRMVAAVEQVRDRLLRASRCLHEAGVPYAVIGGNAVAAWVATVDLSAVRNTQDVDILLRPEDLPRAAEALANGGFIYQQVADVGLFLDGPNSKPSQAVHVILAGQRVRGDYKEPAPDVTESQQVNGIQVVGIEALVRMKLTANRRKDQVHIQDMIGVGLITRDWIDRMPPGLQERLRTLLDDPHG